MTPTLLLSAIWVVGCRVWDTGADEAVKPQRANLRTITPSKLRRSANESYSWVGHVRPSQNATVGYLIGARSIGITGSGTCVLPLPSRGIGRWGLSAALLCPVYGVKSVLSVVVGTRRVLSGGGKTAGRSCERLSLARPAGAVFIRPGRLVSRDGQTETNRATHVRTRSRACDRIGGGANRMAKTQ